MIDSKLAYSIGTIANRSKNQTEFLYNLCECNIRKYIQLEVKLKTNFYFFVPGDVEAVEAVLKSTFDCKHEEFLETFDRTTYIHTKVIQK